MTQQEQAESRQDNGSPRQVESAISEAGSLGEPIVSAAQHRAYEEQDTFKELVSVQGKLARAHAKVADLEQKRVQLLEQLRG